MLEILRHTPSWVYTTFTIVLYLGLSACFESKVTIRRLLYLPCIFILASISSIVIGDGPIVNLLLAWAVGFIPSISIVYWFVNRKSHAYCRQGDVLIVPGNVGILLVSLLFFAVKYWFGYATATDPKWAQEANLQGWGSFVSGFVVGFFTGYGAGQLSVAKLLGYVPRRGM